LSKDEIIKTLTALVQKQQEQIASLLIRVENLEQELALYKKRKNSGNSHIPPSVDLGKPKRNQSLRESSGKKPGGQDGHQGSTLEFLAMADQIIDHTPDYCNRCGLGLEDVLAMALERRQVIDIPMPKTLCTEHRTFAKTCSCGHTTQGKFPASLPCKVQYGAGIEAMTAYLNVRQYMPYNRIEEFYRQTAGLQISQGGIVNILKRFTKKALPVYLEIKNRVEKATCLGSDETGAKVNGKRHWFWTWQNEKLTFIAHSPSRGFKTIQEIFPQGLPNAVLVHDRWAAHFQCLAYDHQICLAHLFRDLNYIHQVHLSDWAISLKNLFKKAIRLHHSPHYDAALPSGSRTSLVQELQLLLQTALPEKDKLAITLQKKLRKINQHILCFLHHNYVPPDNNGSERAIRNVKVKQKISGGFRSIEGADGFAVLRSVIDTTIKSGQEVFYALSLIALANTE